MPKWRNWQTQRTQNPPPSKAYGFDSRFRHQEHRGTGAFLFLFHLFFLSAFVLSVIHLHIIKKELSTPVAFSTGLDSSL